MSSTKFPPISRTHNNSQPFAKPNDNQILLERQQPKENDQNKKIWDKKTASCRTALKRFDKYVMPQDNNFVPQCTFNTKDKKVIESALDIIQMRKKNKDLSGKNQTIVDILEQKKQMFLVTMTHQIIDKQINNLKQQANERQKALKESNSILQQDIKDFDQYQQKYKAETKQIEQRFEKQVQNRVAIEQDIKRQQIVVNSLRGEKSRNQQLINSYVKYKNFLDQFPPKQWIIEKQTRKATKLQQIKQKLQRQWQSSGSFKRNLKGQFDGIFSKILENGQNEAIQEIFHNEEMYFKEPSQMIEFFNNLQQTNLFCIQNTQYSEQKYQQLKLRSSQSEQQLVSKHASLKQHKKLLQKQALQLQNQIKQLKKKKQQNLSLDEKGNSNIKMMIKTEYQAIKEQMANYLPEVQYNTESLALLSSVEICMEKLWEKLRECYLENPKLVKEIKTALQKKNNNQKRDQAAKNNRIQEQNRKIRNLQKKQPTVKIQGRIDMKRSPPQQKIVARKVQTTGKDLDDDKKYLE